MRLDKEDEAAGVHREADQRDHPPSSPAHGGHRSVQITATTADVRQVTAVAVAHGITALPRVMTVAVVQMSCTRRQSAV